MKSRIHCLSIATLFVFTACIQRSDTPPTNRDGIAGGTNAPPRQEVRGPQQGGSEDRPEELPYVDYGERYELGNDQYTVLVGIFTSEQQAQELSYLLRRNRVNNFIDHVRDEWLVCIGKYSSAKGAQKTLELLYKKGAVQLLVQSGYGEPTIHGPGHVL
jgi:cell division septation protein DedD